MRASAATGTRTFTTSRSRRIRSAVPAFSPTLTPTTSRSCTTCSAWWISPLGARVVGVDLTESAAALTRENVRQQGVPAAVAVADGEALPFRDASVDFVYAHGVVQYTGDDRQLVRECQRVLRPGGLAMFQVYHRRSWLHVLSKVMKVPLEHEDAPVLKRYTIA